MVSVGIVSVLNRDLPVSEDGPAKHVEVRRTTPKDAAETFLDAWRKRNHQVALRLSTGPAREQVQARQAKDADLSPEGRAMTEEVWQALADTRLTLVIEEERAAGEDGRILRGRAVGTFMNRRYERLVAFVTRKGWGERWVVEQMSLGEQLSEAPDFLNGN